MNIEYVGKCLLVEVAGKRLLVIGDLHFGYEEALNRSGVFVSRALYKEGLDYLDRVFSKVGGVDIVVLLGDVKHVMGGIVQQEWNDVSGLFEYLSGKAESVVVVKGNHDAILEPIVVKFGGVDLVDFYIVGEVCFIHGNREIDEMLEKNVRVWVMGHAHPAIKISESEGSKIEKFKCFLSGRFKGREVIIVPSFAEHNEGSDVRESELGLAWDFRLKEFEVLVVGEELEVLNFGKLGKMN